MKKKLLALVLVSAMAASFVACGDETTEDTTEETTTEETADTDAASTEGEVLDCSYNPADYVTLGDYLGVEVTLDGEYEYTEEGFEAYVNSDLADTFGYQEDDSLTTVEEDSMINVDYVGSEDGVAFDGGSAEDVELDVSDAAGTYIEGFTTGLPGHEVGEEVAYEVTFPENYGNTDLAGHTVTFTFQINYIESPVATMDTITDDILTEQTDYESVDSYLEAMKESYNDELASNLEDDTQTAVIDTICANATINGCPENLLQARLDMYLESMDSQVSSYYSMTLEEYIAAIGYDYDDWKENMKESLEDAIQEQMVFELIAEKEGIEIDEDEYNDYISTMMETYSLTSEEDFYAGYTIGSLEGKEYFRTIYLADKAMEYCIDNAVVNY